MRNLNVKVYALILACALLHVAAPVARAAAVPQLAASFAGTYRLKTGRPGGEGYDNTLEVEDRGRGRLRVTLSGTYVYKADGEETMREGGAAGEAILRGNIATATVTPDGGDAPCRVLIIFEAGEAGVKSDSACAFNVRLDGTYRAANAKPAGAGAGTGRGRQIRFDKLADFVNDHRANRTGVRYVITSVPAGKVRLVRPLGAGHRGLFRLTFDENDGETATMFVASAELVGNLRNSPVKEAAALRVSAALVEFAGGFDAYRSSFVTKVEGYGEDGSLLWVATGAEPVKVRMRQ